MSTNPTIHLRKPPTPLIVVSRPQIILIQILVILLTSVQITVVSNTLLIQHLAKRRVRIPIAGGAILVSQHARTAQPVSMKIMRICPSALADQIITKVVSDIGDAIDALQEHLRIRPVHVHQVVCGGYDITLTVSDTFRVVLVLCAVTHIIVLVAGNVVAIDGIGYCLLSQPVQIVVRIATVSAILFSDTRSASRGVQRVVKRLDQYTLGIVNSRARQMVTAVVPPRLAGVVGVADTASVTHLVIAVGGTASRIGDADQSVQSVVATTAS